MGVQNVRLDHADTGWFSVAVLTNGVQSWESGMSVLNGDMADNFDDMCVVCCFYAVCMLFLWCFRLFHAVFVLNNHEFDQGASSAYATFRRATTSVYGSTRSKTTSTRSRMMVVRCMLLS